MSDTLTPNLGLHVNGPLATNSLADPQLKGWQTDFNFQTIDAVYAVMLLMIEGITISGLPPNIDEGTF